MPEDNTTPTPSIPPVDPTVASTTTPEPSNTAAATGSTPTTDAPIASDTIPATSEAATTPESSESFSPTPETNLDQSSSTSLYPEVASKISEAKNVLIALSSDPSVDEMAAAIGLSLFLDKLGKRATAIYSGSTPNALEFLKPEETFESTADTLQDFVIALNKEKADHLRYKLDGDFVKIYITPYKTRIAEEDLEFSYGDYNVDLVLALDVANGIDLDSALREHGRIMHDAVIINITTGKPGKFGEIEWSDKNASSVSEMIAKLLYSVDSSIKVGKEEATAFLTGIVAATNRFSNAGTTPETMQIASKLMNSGANQQLVSKNITPDTENEMLTLAADDSAEPKEDKESETAEEISTPETSTPEISNKESSTEVDPTVFDIKRDEEKIVAEEEKEDKNEKEKEDKKIAATEDEKEEKDVSVADKEDEDAETPATEKDNSLLEDLKAAEASLSQAGAEATPEIGKTTLKISSNEATDVADVSTGAELYAQSEPKSEPEPNTQPESGPKPEIDIKPESTPQADSSSVIAAPEKVLQPVSEDLAASNVEDENKYGHMLEDALNSINTVAPEPAATPPTANPAASNAPTVASAPEINGVPEINYMPMPGDEVLPPPPAPPIDMSATPASPTPPTVSLPAMEPIAPAAPVAEPTLTPLGDQPAMQDQVYGPASTDPGAFKIPGM